jgi:preprotein translocase subunit YajC
MEGDDVPLAADSAGSSSGLLTFLPIILLFVAMYFLMIRPQARRRREAQEMQARVGPGDEVQTVGGLFATVVAVDDEAITLEPSPGVTMRYAKGAIARVISATVDETEESPDVDEADDEASADARKTIEQA